MSTLGYSITEPFLRSPVEEWQPHARQSASTIEWWYVTTVLCDASGNLYFV
jgi:predicted secreted hydrolase